MKVQKNNELAKDLKFQTPGSAGADLSSTEYCVIGPGEKKLIGTGLSMNIPKGMCGMVCSRSGMAAKNSVFVLNAPGIIDSDYRGEVKVILHNSGKTDFVVNKEDRIAQMLFVKVEQPEFEYGEIDTNSERGTGGFGSTGK